MKNYYIYILLITAIVSQSCENYLDEDFRSGNPTDEFYGTEDGLEALVGAAYVSNKIWYGQEEGLDLTDIGTDVYSYGPEHPNPEMFTYEQQFNSQVGRIIVPWVEFYKGINAANEAMFYLQKESHPLDPNIRKVRNAEMHFIRAFYLWHLVEQYGPIPMPLEHTTSPITTAARIPVAEVYHQILTDINFAVDNLSETDNVDDANFGRVTKDAARAFRARLSLNLASYISSGDEFGFSAVQIPGADGNPITSASGFYAQAKADADAVIANPLYSFYNDYSELWELGNNSASRNQEGIWAINYSRNFTSLMGIPDSEYRPFYNEGQKPWSDREGGDVRHLMFGMRYDVLPGLHRDLINGRPFRRYFPLNHYVDLYDDNDARWEEQYQLVYYANDDTLNDDGVSIPPEDLSFPRWEDFDLSGISGGFTIPTKYEFTESGNTYHHLYRTGDTAVLQSRKNIPDDRVALPKAGGAYDGDPYYLYVDCGCLLWDESLLYELDQPSPHPINIAGSGNREYFYKLNKFDDPERVAANGEGSERGIRDVYVFRLSEMYLIAAEAIEVGGVAGDARTYLDEWANSRAKDGNGAALVDANIANSENGTMDIHYFLDERAKEFVGEQIRWYDLKRAFSRSEWVTYIKDRNPDAQAIQEHHYFRPIPQIQIDAISNADEYDWSNGYGGGNGG